MAEKPVVAQKAPFVVEVEPGTYFWCACGRTGKQPFCDGSHKGTGLSPVKHEVAQKSKVAWCGCRQSGNGCLCDGSHKRIEG